MKQIGFSICLIFFLNACYNNAHLRTQKILKTDEKVYSGSATINMHDEISGELQWPGVLGFRGEGSMLIGKPWGEIGLFGGLGLMEDGPGYIFGLDYHRYRWTKNGMGLKIGGQVEINIIPQTNMYQPNGYALQLRPSISTITNPSKKLYGGIHGLYSIGRLTEFSGFGYDGDYGWEWIEEEISYSQITYGFGAMVGAEFLFSKTSIQFEIDASLINGKSHVDEIIENDYRTREFSKMLVSGSVGLNLFKSEKTQVNTSGPYPIPISQKEKVKTKQVKFDPITGKEIKDSSGKFEFDPLTGKQVQNLQEKLTHKPIFLGGIVSDIIVKDGKAYKGVKLQSVTQDQLTFVLSKGVLIAQGKTIKKNATQAIDLDKISSMTIYSNQSSISGGVLGCVGGCIVGFITPILLGAMTGINELSTIIKSLIPILSLQNTS